MLGRNPRELEGTKYPDPWEDLESITHLKGSFKVPNRIIGYHNGGFCFLDSPRGVLGRGFLEGMFVNMP